MCLVRFLTLFGGICYHFQHFLAPFQDFLAHGVPKWSQVAKNRYFRANSYSMGTLNLVLFGANGTKRRPRWSKKRTRERNFNFLKTVKNSSVFEGWDLQVGTKSPPRTALGCPWAPLLSVFLRCCFLRCIFEVRGRPGGAR